MDHALAGPQRGKWLVSRDAEYNSKMENHTWDLVYLPNGKKAIQCKWLAKIKTDEKGEPSVYKSRLVAKGFQQKAKEDYKEVFAPTAKSPTLRVLLAVAAVRKWKVKQMDIVTAFLYGIVEEEVYMVQPPGYEDGTGRVCKLNKAIYGLKQAPRCWYNRLASALEGIGFRASACDESLFLMSEGSRLCFCWCTWMTSCSSAAVTRRSMGCSGSSQSSSSASHLERQGTTWECILSGILNVAGSNCIRDSTSTPWLRSTLCRKNGKWSHLCLPSSNS
ncbi:hypothetical protein CLOP_g20693 [Closterium sp. NIES-67]|nr:hypothetical protein CLOP_g20693 [Closterium sp. NIES-67]